MSHNNNNNCHYVKGCRQYFPVSGVSNTTNTAGSDISNRNFPSGASGNMPVPYRSFSPQQVRDFCEYDPVKDYDCCLEEHIDAVPSQWTRAQSEQIRITSTNVTSVINAPFPRISPDLWIWDMWPLMTKDGSVAELPGGWRVLFALSAPRSVLPGKRHDIARIAYFYSRNGYDWIQGGLLFEEGTAFGSRQWAGSAMLDDDGRIYYFYTATGRRGEAQITYEQRIALSSSDYESDLNGVQFVNFAPHEIILEPDGVLYQTQEQSSGGIIYAFRDPFFFKDPATGCEYLLFEGNVAGTAEEIDCGPGVPSDARYYTGNIGIALLRNREFSEWELLPALLEAPCNNQQTERPHIVVHQGSYYLFTDSHRFTFAPGLDPGPGPDGLYGFVAGSLRGDYQPLNDGGLVLANPPQEEYQAYSWLVLPDFSVLSFIDNFNIMGIDIQEVGNLSPEFQYAHFGGTLAPTVQLEVMGNRTRVAAELEYGLVMLAQSESPKCDQPCAEESYDDECKYDDSCHAHRRNRHRRRQDPNYNNNQGGNRGNYNGYGRGNGNGHGGGYGYGYGNGGHGNRRKPKKDCGC
ncbi:glycoside hydrolase family 68 protein [Bacillus sp. AGMB 02131]|uniref:Glycoside hydrolase family 68 protein n=1 Tax=Peribacillus faecalis TaxID=2772559 RepID=A0A927HBM4_9BACI|nr:glycoside hydrolase family 68 protein [Peribacillus faecalis]MBD3109910.1 glycoside hydrolase family 68 protein [Peribacillus faecalis]